MHDEVNRILEKIISTSVRLKWIPMLPMLELRESSQLDKMHECGPAQSVMMTSAAVAKAPLFVLEICVIFDVWHRHTDTPRLPGVSTLNSFSNHQIFKPVVNLLKSWSSLPLNKLTEGIWSILRGEFLSKTILKLDVQSEKTDLQCWRV